MKSMYGYARLNSHPVNLSYAHTRTDFTEIASNYTYCTWVDVSGRRQ